MTTTRVLLALLTALGVVGSRQAYAEDDIDRVLIEAGRTGYEQYCTSCHGPGGAPGKAVYGETKELVDLRTYVARHDGRFPAAKWLAVIAQADPSNVHAPTWEAIQRAQAGSSATVAAARGVVGQIARYVASVQSE